MVRRMVLPMVVLLLAPASASAAGNVAARVRVAKKACLSGDTKKGTELLADLYIDTNDATHIYNQGRCFEQNGQKEQAIPRFEEYLRKAKDLSPEDVDAVHKRIESLQAAVDHRGKPGQGEPIAVPAPILVQPTPTPPAIPPTAAPANPPEALGIVQTAPAPDLTASTPVYKTWWLWTGIGAVVAGGIVTTLVLSSKSAPKSPACTPGVACAQP